MPITQLREIADASKFENVRYAIRDQALRPEGLLNGASFH
jgi:hypothetical protein